MTQIEHQVVINQPITEVFAYLNTPGNVPTWPSGVLGAYRDVPSAIGTHETHVRSVFGRRVENRMEITEYELNCRYSVRGSEEWLPYTFTSLFDEIDGGTEITIIIELEPHGIARVVSPLMTRIMARQIRSDFARLQRMLAASG